LETAHAAPLPCVMRIAHESSRQQDNWRLRSGTVSKRYHRGPALEVTGSLLQTALSVHHSGAL